jgi:hypothetical protein
MPILDYRQCTLDFEAVITRCLVNSIMSYHSIQSGRRGNAPGGSDHRPCPILEDWDRGRSNPLRCFLQDSIPFTRRVQPHTTVDRTVWGVTRVMTLPPPAQPVVMPEISEGLFTTLGNDE